MSAPHPNAPERPSARVRRRRRFALLLTVAVVVISALVVAIVLLLTPTPRPAPSEAPTASEALRRGAVPIPSICPRASSRQPSCSGRPYTLNFRLEEPAFRTSA